jgi:2-haloacid dehalogenase
MGQRWATFDCYGTLIDWERGLGDAMSELWPEADRDRLLRAYHAAEPVVQEEGGLPYREVMARSLAAVAAIHGLEVPSGRGDVLGESLPRWPAFDEVPAALRELRDGGWRLAILSNTDPDLIAASADAIGVPFELVITAREAGSYKPAVGHWERFYADSGAERADHVHVAASLFHDIAPAASMGIRSVWINRLGESSELPRAAELPDLSDLPGTLAALA